MASSFVHGGRSGMRDRRANQANEKAAGIKAGHPVSSSSAFFT
jgi:hypothetical protein